MVMIGMHEVMACSWCFHAWCRNIDMIMYIYMYRAKLGWSWRWDSLPWTSLRYVDYVCIWFIWHGMFAGGRRSKMKSKMVDYSPRDSPYRSDEKHDDEYSHHIEDKLRSLKQGFRSFKADNDRIIQSQERLARALEKQAEVNAVFFRVYQICKDSDHLGSFMDRRIWQMTHMEAGIDQHTRWI